MKEKYPILKFIFNKYFIAFVIFLVAMLLSENHNLRDHMKYEQTITELEEEIDHYRNKTQENKARLQELQSDKENLEKFARERYYMRNADEDLYKVEYE